MTERASKHQTKSKRKRKKADEDKMEQSFSKTEVEYMRRIVCEMWRERANVCVRQ
jgi:hypothetical protein